MLTGSTAQGEQVLENQTLHFFSPFFFQLKPHLVLKTNKHTGKGDTASPAPQGRAGPTLGPKPGGILPAVPPTALGHTAVKPPCSRNRGSENRPSPCNQRPRDAGRSCAGSQSCGLAVLLGQRPELRVPHVSLCHPGGWASPLGSPRAVGGRARAAGTALGIGTLPALRPELTPRAQKIKSSSEHCK